MNSKELDSKRPTLFLLGIISALSLTLMAFEWQSSDTRYTDIFDLEDEGMLIEPDLPQVKIDEPKEVMNDSRQSSSRHSTSMQINLVPDNMPTLDKGPAPMRLALKSPERNPLKGLKRELASPNGTPKSMRTLLPHEFPYMRACGHIKNDIERFQCTQMELRKHVVSSFRIPKEDQLAELPNKVRVTFTIDRYGMITQITPDQDYHNSLSSEIERVLEQVPEMVPANVSGEKIDVRFELPIVLERY